MCVRSNGYLTFITSHSSCPEKHVTRIDPPSSHHTLAHRDTPNSSSSTFYSLSSPTNSRKRRLSDTDISPSPVLLKRPYAGSRHAASDSHPTCTRRGCVPRPSAACLPTIDMPNEEQSIWLGAGSSTFSETSGVASPSDTLGEQPCLLSFPQRPHVLLDVAQTPDTFDSSLNDAPLPELICSDLNGLDGFIKSLLDCTVAPAFPDSLSPSITAGNSPPSFGSPSPSQSSVSLASNSSCPSPSSSLQSLPITPPLCAVIDTPFLPTFDSIDPFLFSTDAAFSTGPSAGLSRKPSVISHHPTLCSALETYLPRPTSISATSDLDLASLFDSDRSCLFPLPDPSSTHSGWHAQVVSSDFP